MDGTLHCDRDTKGAVRLVMVGNHAGSSPVNLLSQRLRTESRERDVRVDGRVPIIGL